MNAWQRFVTESLAPRYYVARRKVVYRDEANRRLAGEENPKVETRYRKITGRDAALSRKRTTSEQIRAAKAQLDATGEQPNV